MLEAHYYMDATMPGTITTPPTGSYSKTASETGVSPAPGGRYGFAVQPASHDRRAMYYAILNFPRKDVCAARYAAAIGEVGAGEKAGEENHLHIT